MKRIGQVLLAGALLLVSGIGSAEKDAARVRVSIDGQTSTFVKRVSGEMAKKKAKLEIDREGADAIWSWVQSALAQQDVQKNVVVPLAGKNTELSQALITEVGFPALDASAKDPATLTVTIEAQKTAPAKGELKGTFKAEVQKRWLPANFRLAIGGLPTARVKKIDALTWTMKVQETKTGSARYVIQPIRVTVDSADAAAWSAWQKTKASKTGSISLTAEDGSVWQTIQLGGLTATSVHTTGSTTVAVLKAKSITIN